MENFPAWGEGQAAQQQHNTITASTLHPSTLKLRCSSGTYGKVSSIWKCFRRIQSPCSPHSTHSASSLLSPELAVFTHTAQVLQHCGGCCSNKLILQTCSVSFRARSCGTSQGCKCRPFPLWSATWQSFPLPNKMTGCGRTLTFITSPSKQRAKPPQPRPLDELQHMQV